MVIPKNQYLKQFIQANHKRVGGKKLTLCHLVLNNLCNIKKYDYLTNNTNERFAIPRSSYQPNHCWN